MDRIVCLSKTSSGQVFTISDKINVSLTSLNQKKGFNKDISASHLYKRLVEEKNRKKASPDPFHGNIVLKVYMAKISSPDQLFYGSRPIFFL